MDATLILTNVALLLVVSALWDEWKQRGALDPARRTRLVVAVVFAAVGILTALWR